ncbi:DMT family transporter [Halobaculum litoreum]|uniref:DMT family transporter n=1 Tax=Halobaculum litoreum TaxID=3031998 RepID=UPI002AA2A11D|nr:DMT family transporter [Halobaculum sp. DT92]
MRVARDGLRFEREGPPGVVRRPHRRERRVNRDAAGFLALAALWGTAFVATKAALADFPPVLLAALRFGAAAATLVAVAVATGRGLRPAGRGDLAPILAGGAFSIGLHHALLFTGQQYVPSAVAATLLGLIPVLTPVAARALRPDDRIDAVGAVGILVGFAGLVLIADPDADRVRALLQATGAARSPAVRARPRPRSAPCSCSRRRSRGSPAR